MVLRYRYCSRTFAGVERRYNLNLSNSVVLFYLSHCPLYFLSAASTTSVIPMTASSSSVLPINCSVMGVPGKSSGLSGHSLSAED